LIGVVEADIVSTTATFDAGQTIVIEMQSNAFPPTQKWYVNALALPLAADGRLKPNAAQNSWFEPITYYGQTGQGFSWLHKLDARYPSEGGYRWFIRIPPQAATHDNADWMQVNVYRRLGR
jgi:hypothetical protein